MMEKEPMAHRRPSRKPRLLPALSVLSGLLAAALLPGCEGSATQTTNGNGLSGILVDPEGRPAAGVQVAVWRAGGLSPIGPGSIPVAMTRTDGNGRYALDLEAGTYNLFGTAGQGSLAVGVPGLVFASETLDLGVRSLLPPGSVSGRALAGGAPAQELFCFIPGSAFVSMTDASGRFSLGQIPPGTYLLRYVKAGYAAAEDSVTVVSDSAIELPDRDMALDIALQPPTPGAIAASVDTANGHVALEWGAVRVPDLKGYVVDARIVGDTSARAKRSWGPVPDTLFTDDETAWRFTQDAEVELGAVPVDSLRVEYRVKAVDNDGNSSPASVTVSATLRRPRILRTEIRLAGLDGLGDSVRCRDTLAFEAVFANPARDSTLFRWEARVWVLGSVKHYPIYNPGEQDATTGPAGSDTFRWYWGKDPAYADAWLKSMLEGERQIDSLTFKVTVLPDDTLARRSKLIDVLMPSPGCYLVRPAREPKYNKYYPE